MVVELRKRGTRSLFIERGLLSVTSGAHSKIGKHLPRSTSEKDLQDGQTTDYLGDAMATY